METIVSRGIHPLQYAKTKCLILGLMHLLNPQPIDFSIYTQPLAWLVALLSFLNTFFVVEILRHGHPIDLLSAQAMSHLLRLAWSVGVQGNRLLPKQYLGVGMALLSLRLLAK